MRLPSRPALASVREGVDRWFLVTAVALVAVVAALLVLRPGGVVVDDPAQGPLEGTLDAGAQLPVPAGAQGVAFGLQTLRNRDPLRRDIVLRSVRVGGAHGGLTLSGTPYVFDDRRAAVAQSGQLVTSIVPLPQEWSHVPRHALDAMCCGRLTTYPQRELATPSSCSSSRCLRRWHGYERSSSSTTSTGGGIPSR